MFLPCHAPLIRVAIIYPKRRLLSPQELEERLLAYLFLYIDHQGARLEYELKKEKKRLNIRGRVA